MAITIHLEQHISVCKFVWRLTYKSRSTGLSSNIKRTVKSINNPLQVGCAYGRYTY